MVYTGIPSKACLHCRKRKLFCDLNRSGCSQCARASLECTGSRDIQALRVINESHKTKHKVQNQKPRRIYLQVQSLTPPIAHQAKDIFFHNYVVGPMRSYHFLIPFYSEVSKHKHLTTSLDAVALAYLDFQRRSTFAQKEARQKYVKALKLTSLALQDPKLATQSSTLLAVLLLDLYEKVTTREPQTDGGWSSHIRGALSIVQLHSQEQLSDPDMVQILTRISTNLLISCVMTNNPVPEDLQALRLRFSQDDDPKAREFGIMISYAKLNYEIKNNLISIREAMSATLDLDAAFQALCLGIADAWRYRVETVDNRSPHHLELYHHIYSDEHIAQMWNVLRLTRILLNEQIFTWCLDLFSTEYVGSWIACELLQSSSDIIKEMALEICATVPQYICETLTGYGPKENPNATQHLPAYRLIFPLYLAARSARLLPSLQELGVKDYALRQLDFMAERHRIENAAFVAGLLREEEKDEWRAWDIYARLGSYAFVC